MDGLPVGWGWPVSSTQETSQWGEGKAAHPHLHFSQAGWREEKPKKEPCFLLIPATCL